MSVVDPVKFFIALIVFGALLQLFGVVEGPCNISNMVEGGTWPK